MKARGETTKVFGLCFVFEVSTVVVKRQTLTHLDKDLERWMKVADQLAFVVV